ncbi:N-acetylmuramoyl-L-alanine amidase [Mucilaginibacter sp. UC70_90]
MKNIYFLLFMAVVATISACSPKVQPFAATNKVYHNQTDSLVEVISREQPAMLVDSAGGAIPSEWVGTVNFNLRKPNYVIIHYTAQDSVKQTLNTFTLVKPQVSAHYVVSKDGKVYHMLNDYLRAWHAGISKWGSITDMNSCSIGIEIDNNGHEPFNEVQVKSLLALLAQLKKNLQHSAGKFYRAPGYSTIAQTRSGAIISLEIVSTKRLWFLARRTA